MMRRASRAAASGQGLAMWRWRRHMGAPRGNCLSASTATSVRRPSGTCGACCTFSALVCFGCGVAFVAQRSHFQLATRTPALLSSGPRLRSWSHAGATRAAALRTAATAPAATAVLEDFDDLAGRLRDLSALSGVAGLMGWDEMTMMPPGAAAARAAQKSALAAVLHSKQTDPGIGEALDRLEASDLVSLDAFQRATVREARRDYRKSTAVSEDLVRREAELESRGYHTWVEARKAKDWSAFAPALAEWVALRRERAALVDPSRPAYDVLADDYAAGLTAARVRDIFDGVKAGLVPLLADLRTRGTPPDSAWLKGEFDTAKQADMCREVSLALGFDLNKGRLDVSVHPFTGGSHPTDVRMTTRFKAGDVMEGLTGAIHETGHALYEQGRSVERDGLPASAAAGMAIHESQSLLWERMVGLSLPFAKYLLPKLRTTFPGAFSEDKTADDLYAAVNVVRTPSKIRVEADEVTYPMHIILRFEIELGLIDGTIQAEEVPRVWNAKMEEYLGVTPSDDAEGCLQDIHWSGGAIGYFPTYSLGAMAAVQIFTAAKAELPGLDGQIAAGEFAPLRAWLREKVHEVGSLYATADELLVAVTGRPLDPEVFLQYLREKYTTLYKL